MYHVMFEIIYFLRIPKFQNFTRIHLRPPAFSLPLSIYPPALMFRLPFCLSVTVFAYLCLLSVSFPVSVCLPVRESAFMHLTSLQLLSLQFWLWVLLTLSRSEFLWVCLIVGMCLLLRLCLSLFCTLLSWCAFLLRPHGCLSTHPQSATPDVFHLC